MHPLQSYVCTCNCRSVHSRARWQEKPLSESLDFGRKRLRYVGCWRPSNDCFVGTLWTLPATGVWWRQAWVCQSNRVDSCTR
ncbi:hypothetical protein BX600DRAFT_123224 [Xylariales sp. PMI_506]|nr:hypothetical protein BX600DRAFT_123224 [Xylariales sp. PMI_506]